MAPPTLPTGDPRRPAEARPHPTARSRPADGAPDLRSMLATLLAVAAILGKVKAAAWGAALVLASAAVNLHGKELGPVVSALPAVGFAFVAIYRGPPAGVVGAPASPREAFTALLGRLTGR